MDVDVAYIVSHGFASRMVTQTDLLKGLVDKGLKVALIAKNKDSQLVDYCNKNNIGFHIYQSGLYWPPSYLLKRRYLTGDSRRNHALRDKHMFDVYYSGRLNPFKRILPLFYYLFLNNSSSRKKKFLEQEKKILQSDHAREFLNTLNPDWLVSTYPVDMLEGELLYNAKSSGINTCIHLLSWDNISCKGFFPSLADHFITWGPVMTEELREYYNVGENKIESCGVPHFDLHVATRRAPDYEMYIKKLGLDLGLPYIMFAMSSPYFAPGEIDIVEFLSNELEDSQIQLLVRPHPQNISGEMADLTWIDRLRRIDQNKNTAVDFPQLNKKSEMKWSMQNNDMIRMSNLITGCRILLNSGSTMSIDALMHFKPVIITSFDGNRKFKYWRSSERLISFPHLSKLIDSKGISVVFNYLELMEEIKHYLSDPDYKSEERYKTIELQVSDWDGNATKKVQDTLMRWVRKI